MECVKQDGSEPSVQVQDVYTCGVCKQVDQDSTQHTLIHAVQDAVLADPEAAEGEFLRFTRQPCFLSRDPHLLRIYETQIPGELGNCEHLSG